MYLIGIAGGSGSGKTTFTDKIIQHLPAGQVALAVIVHEILMRLKGEA